MNPIITQLLELDAYKSLGKGITPVLATGVVDVQKALLSFALINEKKRPAIFVTHSEAKAKEYFADFTYFLGSGVKYYPHKDILFYNADVKSNDILRERFEVLKLLLDKEPIVIVLTIEALFDKLVSKEVFSSFIMDIHVGKEISLDELSKSLMHMGYERSSLVEGVGQFAVRGGIIDLFASTHSNPVRIELWGDEVDSIRIFDPISQKSIEKLETIKVFPARELIYNEETLSQAIQAISSELSKTVKTFEKRGKKEEAETLSQNIGRAIERLKEEHSFAGVEGLTSYFYKETYSLTDYLPKNTMVFIDEPTRIQSHGESILFEFTDSIKNRILKGYLLPGQGSMVFTYQEVLAQLASFDTVLYTTLTHSIKDFKIREIVNFTAREIQTFRNRIDLLIDELNFLIKKKSRVVILAGVKSAGRRIVEHLTENGLRAKFVDSLEGQTVFPEEITVTTGSLSNGFVSTENGFAIISLNDLFKERTRSRRPRAKKNASKIESFTDLKVNDHIVHQSHGIGIFKGIEQIVSDGIPKDYLKLEYSDGGFLYVDITQMDMLQKYIGGSEAKLKLNKLGGSDWNKAKAKTKAAVTILAKELVALYAKRQDSKGYSFNSDVVWQQEFEEKFPFEETPDQLSAIAEVKSDMESAKVMDRLICGDVGYGKTEIAIRAAFKAVQDGKQVAYLVPTTILAQQHYNTFVARMRDYPIQIELLSRFRTKKEITAAISNLQRGQADIVIGTHRLLSKDIVFKDLGLVIVDEEQRFGVGHKEKLKQLKTSVDVLTLTATPIPRTLHMSLTGIRDMSILEEPPLERQPIQTFVCEYNDEFIRDAIKRELARKGQVYFLYNRVSTISEMAARVKRLVPEASVSYAHGQMAEAELESVMLDFIDNETDVLVCTTIIETGLDISNVNTIIIHDADKMGLSQLYQLRGRVGRSNRQAFAYLMYRKNKVLDETAEKRLQTIREFTEFGSGIKIAMRDLEIRGAGNLIGGEQHGHMDAVGYDMYCKLLQEAIKELKGEITIPEFETKIDIKVSAYIPETYIENQEQRLEIYKKISFIENVEDYNLVQEEIEDRYGDLPKSVQCLLEIAMLKATAHKIGITSITEKKQYGKPLHTALQFKPETPPKEEKLITLMKKHRGLITYSKTPLPTLLIKSNEAQAKIEPAVLTETLKELL